MLEIMVWHLGEDIISLAVETILLPSLKPNDVSIILLFAVGVKC